MRQEQMLLIDPDEAYALRLSGYLEERAGVSFQVKIYTDPACLEGQTDQELPDFILIAEGFFGERERWGEAAKRMVGASRCFVLSGEEETKQIDGFPVLYKYQSADALVRTLLDAARREDTEGEDWSKAAEDGAEGIRAKLLGIYSPIGRCGKTSFSIALGMCLAKQRRTLYLNLEDYHGFARLNGDGRSGDDLADLIYFARNKEGSLHYKLGSMVEQWQELDYIRPVFLPADLKEVTGEEWLHLFRLLAVSGEYEMILLDLGTQMENVFRILALCSRIYMPCLRDFISEAKLQQFQQNLEALRLEGLRRKIMPLLLPDPTRSDREGRWPQSLAGGDMGEYVRCLVKREKLLE